jgi:hypothetical protein
MGQRARPLLWPNPLYSSRYKRPPFALRLPPGDGKAQSACVRATHFNWLRRSTVSFIAGGENAVGGASAVELQLGGDKLRPLWMFPVDGFSIQIYPAWAGERDAARYAQVVGYGTAFGGGTVAEPRNDELMYIRPNASSATPFGLGPLEVAFDTINNILQVAESTGNQRSSILLDLSEGYTQGDLDTFGSYWMNEIEGQGKVPTTAIRGSGRSDEKSKRGVEVLRLYPEGDNGMFLEYQRFLIRRLALRSTCRRSVSTLT